jgi:hypothetical protein
VASPQRKDAFLNSFMRGFSFIDDINQRKQAQLKLDARLEEEAKDREFRRQAMTQKLAESGADRARSILNEQEAEEEKRRAGEFNRLYADPNTPDEELEQFTDLPGASALLRNRRLDTQRQGDLETVFSPGLNAQATGVQAGQPQATEQPGTQQPGTEGLSGQVQAAQLPPDEFAADGDTGVPYATARDLNELADTDPQAAMQLRDQQAQQAQPQPQEERRATSGPLGITPTGPSEKVSKAKAQRAQLEDEWKLFTDINDPTGDSLRNMSPSLLTAKYFDDRNNISDPNLRNTIDKRMKPVIAETIAVQQEAFTTATEPREKRNASRKLSEAYGLANNMHLTYKPIEVAGIDERGYPIGTTNQTLIDGVEQATATGPTPALPPDPRTRAANIAMVNRGVSGKRMPPAFNTAAYRLLKTGDIDMEQYQSLFQTGRLPAEAPKIVQRNPKFDTYMVYPDGSQRVVSYARDPEAESESSRNLISKEGRKEIEFMANILNTDDDQHRGDRDVLSFMNTLVYNEDKAKARGYDYSTTNDIVELYQRHLDIEVINKQMEDEWIWRGTNGMDVNPHMVDHYGNASEALFSSKLDRDFASGRITDELDAPNLTPLRGRNPAVYDAARELPQYEGWADEQIEEEIQRQEQARGR